MTRRQRRTVKRQAADDRISGLCLIGFGFSGAVRFWPNYGSTWGWPWPDVVSGIDTRKVVVT